MQNQGLVIRLGKPVAWALLLATLVAGCGRVGFGEGERDQSQSDAGLEELSAGGPGSVRAAALRMDWVTPYSARLRWDRSGEEDSFADARIWTAPSIADLGQRAGSAVVRDPRMNPRLGSWVTPNTSDDPVDSVVLWELVPNSTYYVLLEYLDSSGELAWSNSLRIDTPAVGNDEIVLFSESDTPGYSIPSTLGRKEGDSQGGSYHYENVYDCPDADAESCFDILRRQGVDQGLDALSIGDVENAYVEAYIRVEAGLPSYWSHSRLWLEGGDGDELLFINEDFSIPALGRYVHFALPLAGYISRGQSLAETDLSPGLWEWGFGGFWPNGRPVQLDEVRIRFSR